MPDSNLPNVLSIASALVARLSRDCKVAESMGSLSPSVYDTAWLAMIVKKVEGKSRWLFPECFQYLLSSQHDDGSWGTYHSEIDGVLNTMAALLALQLHARDTHIQDCPVPSDLEEKSAAARQYLRQTLKSFDTDTSEGVGFELLIPLCLDLLEKQGTTFEFPGRKSLMSLYQQKMAKFQPDVVYTKHDFTIIHSLEALVGKIEFDRVSHHLVDGSMLCSPAATASYLMNCSAWNDEAEAYLRRALSKAPDGHHGSVPGTFPTSVFELTWTISTLVENGFTVEMLGRQNVDQIGDFLEAELVHRHGVIGMAPNVMIDVDDSGKTITTLNLIGRPTFADGMVAEFEVQDHFRCYPAERNASFSANCNALTGLLSTPDPRMYERQILKIATFLCDQIWDGPLLDKWNRSPRYLSMLFSESMVHLLSCWENGILSSLPTLFLESRVPLTVLHVLLQTFDGQELDGSWDGLQSPEVTSYALLTISKTASLPWAAFLEDKMRTVLSAGREFLQQNIDKWANPGHAWTGKVAYFSPVLSQSYCLAAFQAVTSHSCVPTSVARTSIRPLQPRMEKLANFFSSLPMLADHDQAIVNGYVAEGMMFLEPLLETGASIFDNTHPKTSQYLEYISVAWIAMSHLYLNPISLNEIRTMLNYSIVIYGADEFVEGVIGVNHLHDLDKVRSIGRDLLLQADQDSPNICANQYRQPNILSNETSSATEKKGISALDSITSMLDKLCSYILTLSKHRNASPYAQDLLRRELARYLFASFDHLQSLATIGGIIPEIPYFEWVSSTGAEDSATILSLVFYCTLISSMPDSPKGNHDLFAVGQTRYLIQDLGRHLGVVSRMENDIGSLCRDRAEGNLNSIDFFGSDSFRSVHGKGNSVSLPAIEDELRSQDLRSLVEFEWSCVSLTMDRLSALIPCQTFMRIAMFVDLVKLFGQIYAARDISKWIGDKSVRT